MAGTAYATWLGDGEDWLVFWWKLGWGFGRLCVRGAGFGARDQVRGAGSFRIVTDFAGIWSCWNLEYRAHTAKQQWRGGLVPGAVDGTARKREFVSITRVFCGVKFVVFGICLMGWVRGLGAESGGVYPAEQKPPKNCQVGRFPWFGERETERCGGANRDENGTDGGHSPPYWGGSAG